MVQIKKLVKKIENYLSDQHKYNNYRIDKS